MKVWVYFIIFYLFFVTHTAAKSTYFECEKNYFNFHYECYACTLCPPNTERRKNECTEKWGLPANQSCAPSYKPPDTNNKDNTGPQDSSTSPPFPTKYPPSPSLVTNAVPLHFWEVVLEVVLVAVLSGVLTAILVIWCCKKKKSLHRSQKELAVKGSEEEVPLQEIQVQGENSGIDEGSSPYDLDTGSSVSSSPTQEEGHLGCVEGGVPMPNDTLR